MLRGLHIIAPHMRASIPATSRMCARGHLPAVKIDGAWCIDPADLDARLGRSPVPLHDDILWGLQTIAPVLGLTYHQAWDRAHVGNLHPAVIQIGRRWCARRSVLTKNAGMR
jgi:hypothetical protein